MTDRLLAADAAPHPRHVVWELTLRGDLACRHCGSRAGRPRAEELSLDEALGVLDQLAALGTREIAFIGGEAYLKPDWLKIVAATASRGIRPVTPIQASRQERRAPGETPRCRPPPARRTPGRERPTRRAARARR